MERKINKLLQIARETARRDREADIRAAYSRMTTEQLTELAYGEPSEGRIEEIFASVGADHLLKEVYSNE